MQQCKVISKLYCRLRVERTLHLEQNEEESIPVQGLEFVMPSSKVLPQKGSIILVLFLFCSFFFVLRFTNTLYVHPSSFSVRTIGMSTIYKHVIQPIYCWSEYLVLPSCCHLLNVWELHP
jgi:hypothetical protein